MALTETLSLSLRLRRAGFSLQVALTLPPSGVVALVGPSGSGKSTLLRAVAGLERPQAGFVRWGEEVWFDGARGIHRPPQRRRVGMVFQDYALFEHLTVAANVGFGVPRGRRAAQVRRWLEALQLTALAQAYPRQLSGGQRQRVALARALAPEPRLLLLDEPFSALDAPLRGALRAQLADLVRRWPRPVLLVSHDLEDARRLASWMGVLVDGRLVRFGETQAVFRRPGSAACARLLGWRNLLPLQYAQGRWARGAWGAVELPEPPPPGATWVAIRPEHVRLRPLRPEGLMGRVLRIDELGAVRAVSVRLPDGTELEVHRPWDEPLPAPGEAVSLQVLRSGPQALPELPKAPVLDSPCPRASSGG